MLTALIISIALNIIFICAIILKIYISMGKAKELPKIVDTEKRVKDAEKDLKKRTNGLPASEYLRRKYKQSG